MSQENITGQLGPGGDQSSFPSVNLSDLTALNPSFRRFIGADDPTVVNGGGGGGGAKRGPAEIAKKLEISQKRRPMRTCEEELEKYKNENLELRLKLYKLQSSSGEDHNAKDVVDNKQDIVYILKTQIKELEKELSERDRKEKSAIREASCQTNLDLLNIEHLFRDRKTLKELEQQRYHQQQQQQIIEQIHYPSVMTQPSKTQTLLPDERRILETAYRLKGAMTTARDILKAKTDTQ